MLGGEKEEGWCDETGQQKKTVKIEMAHTHDVSDLKGKMWVWQPSYKMKSQVSLVKAIIFMPIPQETIAHM